jgi:AraC-like DNA-binding protein
MAREKPLFRVNLDRLDAAFPNKEVLSLKDIADFTGKSVRTITRKFKTNPDIGGISKTVLANRLAQE